MTLEVVVGGSDIDIYTSATSGPTGRQGPRGEQGEPGPQGEQGEIGPAGPSGPRGLQGVQGIQGPTGSHGPSGSTGSQGVSGPQGPRGEQGIQGSVGPAGPTGPQGTTGSTGPRGFVGATGTTGATGLTGATGPKGLKGDIGPVGLKGDKGQTGSTGALGPPGPIGLTGPTGPQGPEGDPGIPGSPGAPGPTGEKGDTGTGLSIQGTNTWDVISLIGVPETGETWILQEDDEDAPSPPGSVEGGSAGDGLLYDGGWLNIGPIRGPEGPTGPKGDDGDQGLTGLTGEKGDKGNQGDEGQPGLQGPRGLQGIQGLKGDKGDKGDKGNTGATGATGIGQQGEPGPIGPIGIQGTTGPQGPQGVQGIEGPTGIQGTKGDKGDKGDLGFTGPIGHTGDTGPMGPGVTVRGTATWTVIQALTSQVAGDLWILSVSDASAPSLPGSSAGGTAGDGLAWTGTAPWFNAGPIRGPQGLTGATGATGPIGPTGLTGSTGPAGAASTVPGPTGIAGPQGSTGPKGDGIRVKGTVPTSANLPTSSNIIGDIYIADNTGNGWEWNGTTWLEIGRLRGNQGLQGPIGLSGIDGDPGATGANGLPGPQGPPGPDNYEVLDVRYLTSASGGSVGMATGGAGRIAIRGSSEALKVMQASTTTGGSPLISWYDKTGVTRYGYMQYRNGVDMVIATEGTLAAKPPIYLLVDGVTKMTIADTVITTTVPINVKAITSDNITADGDVLANGIGRFSQAGGSVQLLDPGADDNCYMAFYGKATSLTTLGARSGYFGFAGNTTMYLNNEINGGSVILRTEPHTTPGGIFFQPNGVTAGQFAGNNFSVTGNITAGGTVTADPPTAGTHLTTKTYVDTQRDTRVATAGDLITGGMTMDLPTATTVTYLQFKAATVVQGSLTATTATKTMVLNSASDYRLKEHVEPLSGALDRIMSTRPVAYQLRDTKAKTTGFIAHELADVYPEAVTGTKDAVDDKGEPVHQMVATSLLIPDIVAAIKELAERVVTLESA